MIATGKFEVVLKPLEHYAEATDGITLGRMSIDKIFTGDLIATSQGEMLNALSTVKGSAGYVAVEQVKGELSGRKGSFVLQHYGMMSTQGQRLILEVIADYATGEMKGLTGKMAIKIEDGEHSYSLEYEFNAS